MYMYGSHILVLYILNFFIALDLSVDETIDSDSVSQKEYTVRLKFSINYQIKPFKLKKYNISSLQQVIWLYTTEIEKSLRVP